MRRLARASTVRASLSQTYSLRSIHDFRFPRAPAKVPLPFVGNVLDFKPQMMHHALVDFAQQLNSQTFILNFFGRDLLIVGDASLAQHITQGKSWGDRAFISVLSDVSRLVAPELGGQPLGVVLSNGRVWRMGRDPASRGLQKISFIRGATASVSEIANRWLDRWDETAGTPVDADEGFHRITMDIIGRLAFDVDFGNVCGRNTRVSNVILQVNADLGPLLLMPPYWRYVPSPAYHRVKEGMLELVAFAKDIVARRRSAGHQGGKECFVDLLLDGWGDSGLSDDVLSFAVIDIMVAGSDTTANTLSQASWMLASHPEVQQKARDEVRRVLGPSDDQVTPEKLEQLQYLGMVIKETQRLWPAVPVMSRVSTEPTQWQGHELPAGTEALVAPWLLGRNPSHWPSAEAFCPERFEGGGRVGTTELSANHPYAYLPFGFGVRGCIGARLAVLELKVALAHLLRRFRSIELAPEEVQLRRSKKNVVSGATLKMAPPLKLVLTR